MGSKDGEQSSEESGLKTSAVTQSRVEIRRRTISPYDLSSSDNSGSVISQPLLKGPNYNEWSTNLRMALFFFSARNLQNHIDSVNHIGNSASM